VGFQGTSVNIGELWATYDIEVLKTILPTASLATIPDHWVCIGASTGTYLGTSQVLNSGNTGSTINSAMTGILLPVVPIPMEYIVTYSAIGSVSSLTNVMTTTKTGTSNVSFWGSGTINTLIQSGGAESVTQFISSAISVAASTVASIVWGNGTLPSPLSGVDITVTPLPQGATRSSRAKVSRTIAFESKESKSEEFTDSEDEAEEELIRGMLKKRRAKVAAAAAAVVPPEVPVAAKSASLKGSK